MKIVRKQNFNVAVDPLNFMAELQVLSGDIVQSLNHESGEYEPDRLLVPLLLMPFVTVQDSNGIMKGKVAITNAEWFMGLPDTGTLITNNDDFKISASGTPAYSLKVLKNIEPNSPLQITCRFTFTDARLNQSISIERSVSLRTTYYDSTNYSVKLNQPGALIVDPMRCAKNEKGEWPVTITAQLYSGKETVPDTNAAYWWYILENGNYRLIDPDNDLFMLTAKTQSGSYPQTITVDARFIASLRIKVRAAYHTGTEPDIPQIDPLQESMTIQTRLPQNIAGIMNITKGQYIAPNTDQPIEAECVIYDNKTIIQNPTEYYDITWYAQQCNTGSTPKVIGYGQFLKTTSKTIGITNTDRFDIWPDVEEKGVFGPLSDGDTILTDNGVILITQ